MINNNRDFYLAVLELISEYKGSSRSLEHYLHTVLAASFEYSKDDGVTLDQLMTMLRAGFEREVPTHDVVPMPLRDADFGFKRWFSIAARQIRDLREMRVSGALEDPMRYFGIEGPNGETWYNFDPVGFLECGAAGYFDGWRPGDPTNRKSTNPEPEEKICESIEIEGLYWRGVADFLYTCQIYE